MKGYYVDYCYLGLMPNGQWREFVSEEEYFEAYKEEQES